jgi:alkanesulfonate monooxygenase SsuD/methylene tetrahydromethanopterin reductase-like flavin-dependent oxidoreductase (luciferase family)
MDIGYSITSFHQPDVPAREAADSVVERARAAREAGVSYVECGDHHVVTDGQYLQSIPMTARLAAVFDHVAPLALVPLYDPVLLAEQVGTLGALADDVDLWCGLGHEQSSYDAFGVPMAERGARMAEALASSSLLAMQIIANCGMTWASSVDDGLTPALSLLSAFHSPAWFRCRCCR